MTDANLTGRARQGDPTAIAALLNRTFKSQKIQVNARRQGSQLQILLVASSLPQRTAVVPFIIQGLKRLQPQGIETVQIYARQPNTTQMAWRTHMVLGLSVAPPPTAAEPPPLPGLTPSEPPPIKSQQTTAKTSIAESETADADAVEPPPLPSPPPLPETSLVSPATTAQPPPLRPNRAALATTTPPLVLPGWSFWFGWVVLTLISSMLTTNWPFSMVQADWGLYLSRFLQSAIALSLVGVGQWLVLRQEVDWAKQWLEMTMIGALISSGLRMIWLPLRSPLGDSVFGLTVVSIVITTLTAAPIMVTQWLVLRQHLAKAHLWLWINGIAILVIALLPQWNLLWNSVLPIGWLWSVLNWPWLLRLGAGMLGGATMVYLLRQSAVENLKLNRLTDLTTRRQLLRQRASINGLFFLQWASLTLAGWVMGVLLISVFGLGLILSPTTIAGCQWILLRHNMSNSKLWIQITAITSLCCFGAVLLIILPMTLQVLYNTEALPALSILMINTALPAISLLWLAIIVAQSRVLHQQGYRATWWLLVHLGIILIIIENAVHSSSLILPGFFFWLMLVPAATMVWLLGYPKSLRPRFFARLDEAPLDDIFTATVNAITRRDREHHDPYEKV